MLWALNGPINLLYVIKWEWLTIFTQPYAMYKFASNFLLLHPTKAMAMITSALNFQHIEQLESQDGRPSSQPCRKRAPRTRDPKPGPMKIWRGPESGTCSVANRRLQPWPWGMEGNCSLNIDSLWTKRLPTAPGTVWGRTPLLIAYPGLACVPRHIV